MQLQLYGHQPPIFKTIQIRPTKMQDTAGEVMPSTNATFSYGPLLTDVQVLGNQLELINNSSVRTYDVLLKTCQKRWTNGERESQGNSY